MCQIGRFFWVSRKSEEQGINIGRVSARKLIKGIRVAGAKHLNKSSLDRSERGAVGR